ncbi:MAG: ABC transporter permease [Ignavibacteria bacterium]|nr:ABC transporter permease [Ignavibacteria bacterium]
MTTPMTTLQQTTRFTLFYATSQLRLRYRYTSLGFLWNFLEPAMFLVVLSVIFSVVNRMDISDYAVFLFAALVPWRYLEKIVNSSMESIVGGDWLIKRMSVSPMVLPMTRWIMASVEFVFSMVVVFLLFGFLKPTWTVHLVVLPLSVLPWSLFGLGLGLIAAVLFTFFRDVRPIVQMVLMLTFFSSPILFRPDIFGEGTLQSAIIQFHPMTYFSALFQKPVYFAQWPSPEDWVVSFLLSLLAMAAGITMMRRYSSRFYYYL